LVRSIFCALAKDVTIIVLNNRRYNFFMQELLISGHLVTNLTQKLLIEYKISNY